MSRTLTDPNAGSVIRRVLPIYNGGSDEITAPAALDAYNGIPSSLYNQPNGIPGLGNDGKLPYSVLPDAVAASVTLIGPELLFIGSKGIWTITNYDSQIEYVLSASAGVISQYEESIFFIAPNTAQTVTLQINDKIVTVAITEQYTAPPVLLVPIDASINEPASFTAVMDNFSIVGQEPSKALQCRGVNNFYKTPAVAGDRKKWTWSGWVRRDASVFGTTDAITGSGISVSASEYLAFNTSNQILFYADDASNSLVVITSTTFTHTEWLNIVLHYDSAQALVADRVKIFVNDVLQPLGTDTVTLNRSSFMNNTSRTAIGGSSFTNANGIFFTGFIAEVNFIDGQIIPPSDFGYVDPTTSKWYPKAYTGTYGQNGFYLDFEDDSSVLALGYDKSGRNNHYTNYTSMLITDSSNDGPIAIYQESSDWQLSTDPSFTTVFQESLNDTVNLLTWPITGLALNTTYYLRCRRSSALYGTSEWSAIAHFTTREQWLPMFEKAVLIASDIGASDQFGESVAISADGLRIVSASMLNDATATSSGLSYVFKQEDATWVEEQAITPPSDATSGYGISVAVDATGTRMIVGSYLRDSGGILTSGAAFIYLRTGTTWTQEANIVAAGNVAADWFGYAVDIDADGSRVAIGCPQRDVGATNTGRVYIFTRSGSTWTQEAAIDPADRALSDYFGISVALTPDGSRLVAGAYNKTVGGVSAAGQVYVYSRSDVTWTQEAAFSASDKATSDQFGTTVDISEAGDVIVVGAPLRNAGGTTDAGQVYVFTRSGSVWSEQATLIAADKAASDTFGKSISLSDDGALLAISAPAKTVNAVTGAGKVYLYAKLNGVWSERLTLSASDKVASDQFGNAIVFASDGFTLVVAAKLRNSNGITDSGALYIFQ